MSAIVNVCICVYAFDNVSKGLVLYCLHYYIRSFHVLSAAFYPFVWLKCLSGDIHRFYIGSSLKVSQRVHQDSIP